MSFSKPFPLHHPQRDKKDNDVLSPQTLKKIRRWTTGKSFIVLTSTLVILLVSLAAALSVQLFSELQGIIGQQFNEQQFIIAQNAKSLIEREMGLIRRDLSATARELDESPADLRLQSERLKNSLFRMKESGVQQIELVDLPNKDVYICASYGHTLYQKILDGKNADIRKLKLIKDGEVWVSDTRIKNNYGSFFMVIPLVNHPGWYLRYVINTTWLVKPFLKNIRSGLTGYAWLIDQDGIFLFHQEAAFIGKNAFDVRKEKNPSLSYEEINYIQREKMLKGDEGVGQYYSGWHRGLTGLIKKLIAYAPIHMSESPLRIWSVAVVAPVSEIEDKIRHLYIWQFILQVFILMIIFLSGLTLLLFEKKWSQSLETRVNERTEELKRSEEKYRLLLESAEDYIFTIDSDYCLESMNRYTAKFFGGLPEDLTGRDFAALFPPQDAEQQVKLIRMVLWRGKSVRGEFEWNIGAGNFWVDANFMPLKSNTGRVHKVLCIARDVTENKKLERNLINTEKLASLGTLAAGVAHEINNPLGVILGFVDILLRQFKSEDPIHEDLKIIERQGWHCKQIVENLLSFARFDETDHHSCDLNHCLRDILQIVRHSLEMNQITLEESYTQYLPKVRGDARKLQQVFLNLINNAAAAVKKNGHIVVRTKFDREKRQAIADVIDNGPGIKAEHMEHIYEPFFTTKPAGEGTGLGLFITYGIINQLGGSIDCVSRTAEQTGSIRTTKFTIKLQTVEEAG